MDGQILGRWMVFNFGCIECGVSSSVVGIYQTKDEADQVVDALDEHRHWRRGGQNSFEIFDLSRPMQAEYIEAIAKSRSES